MKMELFIEKASPVLNTLRVQDVIGKQVLAQSGIILGRVTAVHLHEDKYTFEGIVVKKLFRTAKYICKTYIAQVTDKAVILSIEPALLFEGRAVVSADGKKIGTVRQVHRVGNTNAIGSLTVSRGWFRKMTVPRSHIQHLGTSIMLVKSHGQLKHDRTK